jgi:hypothetical protein
VQDKAFQLFTEVESQGTDLEQVVTTTEQHLEGLVNDTVIQYFTEEEATTKQQVEATRAKIKAFKAELIIPDLLGTSHR